MDAKRRANLIKELSAGKGLTKPTFDPNYTRENRVWFVSAIVDAILAPPTPSDDAVEGLARGIINGANSAVKDESDFSVGVKLDEKLAKNERKDLARRVETIYGVIAQNSALVGPLLLYFAKPMRQFLSKRRYRAVVRMIYEVNPNANGFMWYPTACDKHPRKWQVCKEALTFWENVEPNRDTPLKVSGQNTPAEAIAKIWETPHPKPDQCNGNLLDCSNAVCCMLLDSLGEAAHPKQFYDSIQKRGPEHLLIVNPNSRQDTQCLWEKDDEPHRIFTKDMVKETDFQVGDHVDIENHGLYKSVVPLGFWFSEHSLVTNCGNRNPDDGKGVLFGGHGLPQPIHIGAVYDTLVKDIQTRLHRTFKMTDLFLSFRKDPSTIPAAQVDTMVVTVTDPRSQHKVKVEAFKFKNTVVEYDDYTTPPKKGKKERPKIREGQEGSPLVIFDIPELNQIAIAPPTANNAIVDQLGRFSAMTFLRRDPLLQRDPTTGHGKYYDREFWKILFDNSMTNKDDDLYPVFGGKGGTFRLLERKEMPTGYGRYFRSGHDEPAALVTRPHVDTSGPYLSYLESIGAISRA
jgi:hypothetical protein